MKLYESGVDINTPIIIFDEVYNAVCGLGDKGIVEFWNRMGLFYYGEESQPSKSMRFESVFEDWKKRQTLQAKRHRANRANIGKRYKHPTTTPTTTPTTRHPTVLPFYRSTNSTSVPLSAHENGNGDSVETGIGNATAEFIKSLSCNPDAFFDYVHDAVAICRAVTGDTHSDGCWRKLIREKGEEAVRSAVRDCWSNWRSGEEPDNKGAALTAELKALPDVDNGGKEAR